MKPAVEREMGNRTARKRPRYFVRKRICYQIVDLESRTTPWFVCNAKKERMEMVSVSDAEVFSVAVVSGSVE